MLHSKTLLKKSQETNNELANLQFLMKQRLVQLEFIEKLVKGTDHKQAIQERIQNLEDQCQQSHLELRKDKIIINEKTKELKSAQKELNNLQNSLDSLYIKYDLDAKDWEEKYSFSQEQKEQLERYIKEKDEKIDTLDTKNQELNQQVEELRFQLQQQVQHLTRKEEQLNGELKQKEEQLDGELKRKEEELNGELKRKEEDLNMELKRKKEQLNVELKRKEEQLHVELKEKEEQSNIELKLQLNQLQHKVNNSEIELQQHIQSNQGLKSIINEKDTLLRSYHSRIEPEEHFTLLRQFEILKQEHEQCKNINHSREEFDLEKGKNNSRIPVLSNRAIQQQYDLSKELNLMKDDLLLYQDKLVEKISQNKQLETAMERVNEHVLILKKSLNDTREESTQRYINMMKYMEENRLLRELLDGS